MPKLFLSNASKFLPLLLPGYCRVHRRLLDLPLLTEAVSFMATPPDAFCWSTDRPSSPATIHSVATTRQYQCMKKLLPLQQPSVHLNTTAC